MKNLKKFAFIAALAIFSASCDEEEGNSVQFSTIEETILNNPSFDSLEKAVVRAGLTTAFQGSSDFTVFAPTNAAFAELVNAGGLGVDANGNDIEDISLADPAVLREIVLNHVIAARVRYNQVATGYVKTLGKGGASTTNTLSMYIRRDAANDDSILDGGDITLNGNAKVTAVDLVTNNGIIHVVDKVIAMPTVVTHAAANSNFTTLVSLVTARPSVATLLSGNAGSPFTVFAPTNDAFNALNAELAGSGGIAAVPFDTVTNILTYHVVAPANVLSTGIPSGPINTLLNGSTFSITGTVITDANERTSNIVAVDVQATNGVIHVIDKVLLP